MTDFVQIMLEQPYKSKTIWNFILDYHKKMKIDLVNLRELFLLFCIKRKLKLMSLVLNK